MSNSKILTHSEVAEIEARERLATKEPWTKYYRVSPRGAHEQWHIGNELGLCQITMNGHERDYDFMAHAREDVPALCSTVRQLLSKNERAAKHLGDYDQLVGHLRQENARLKADVKRFSELADERHDQLWEARRQRDDLAAKCAPYLETLK